MMSWCSKAHHSTYPEIGEGLLIFGPLDKKQLSFTVEDDSSGA